MTATGSSDWSLPRGIAYLPGAVAASLFAFLLISTTSGVYWIESWHDEQRALQIVVLSPLALLVGWRLTWQHHRPIDPLMIWMTGAFIGIGLVSALCAQHVNQAFAEMSLLASLFLLALGIASLVAWARPQAIRFAYWLALLLALVHAVGILTRYAAALQLQRPLDTMVLLLGYANPRFPSALYALLVPLVAVLAADRTERRDIHWVANATLVLLWCFNIALQTRAMAFAYVIAVPVVVAALGWRSTSALALRLVATAVAGAALYAVMFLAVPEWIGTGLAQASREGLLGGSGREALLAMSWESIRQSPWLGIGPMGFAAIPNRIGAHPHNWIVQLAVEWGLPAAFLATAGVAFGLRKASRRICEMFAEAQPSALLSVGAFLAVVVGLVYGLVDGNLVMPVSQTAFVIVVGILVGSLMPPAVHAASAAANRGLRVAVLAVAAASSFYLIWYLTQTLPQQEARRAWYQQNRVSTPYLLPRFWEQGLIPPAQQMIPVTE